MNFIDIHCHPSMKMYLFERQIHKPFQPKGKSISTNMFVNLPNMRAGGVNAAISVHYLPEADLTKGILQTFAGGFIEWFMQIYAVFFSPKFEDRSAPKAPYYQMLNIISRFEESIKVANQVSGLNDVAIAKNFKEFETFIKEGKIVFVHSIESANCLGYGITDTSIILDEVNNLFRRGVCQFTIAHFFQNVLVSSQGGIPPNIRKLLKYDAGNTYINGYNEKNDMAKVVLSRMLDLGIILDLVHCTPKAREMIYKLNDDRGIEKRPLVFSHTGIRDVVLKYRPDFPKGDVLYLPDDEDIRRIKACGGVIGIIFMDYWLNGKEETKPALDLIIETIKYVHKVCGYSYENIAIGSDLDGFTQVPSDLAGANYMDELVHKMRTSDIEEKYIKAICFDNYVRVLKNGWGSGS